MKKKLNKDEILTIPNGLSFLRLLLTSLIVWLYCGGGGRIRSHNCRNRGFCTDGYY